MAQRLLGLALATALLGAGGTAAATERIVLLVSEADTYIATKAAKTVELPPSIAAHALTLERVAADPEASRLLSEAKVIVADVMIAEIVEYLFEHADPKRQRLYGVRASRDDARLAAAGFLFDDRVKAYFDHLSTRNVANLLALVA